MNRIYTNRILRPLKMGRRSQKFFVCDIETGIKHPDGRIEYFLSARPEHLLFGVIYGENFCKVLRSADAFIQEFKKKRYKNKIVYAHNAEYDFSGIFGNIYLMDNNAIFNGKFIMATNGNAKFADSYNLLPTSVAKLGELLGLPKDQLGNSNLESHVRFIHNDIKYCKRDCEIVYKSLKKMFAGYEPSYTIGSHAVKVFRSTYLKKRILITDLADKFFDAMYGGRTEAFKIGDCNANVYDINSAYPFAMTKQLPDCSRLVDIPDDKIYSTFRNIDYNNTGGMITATVYIHENERLPILPVKHDGKLLFPTGLFTGSWCLNEFRYAQLNSNLTIVAIHNLIIAPLQDSPFTEFVNGLFTLRSQTDDIYLRLKYKLELNNLYGKLVQRLKDEYKFFENEKQVFAYMRKTELKKCEINKVVGGYFVKYLIDKVYNHTIPCFGAYITAYVRIQLHEMMKRYYNDLVYCDTDSVFLERDLDLNETFLGGWKREEKIVKYVRTLKDYVYVDEGTPDVNKRMLKGIKKNAQQLTKDAKIFTFKRMIKTKESMRRKDCLPPGTFIEQIKLLTGDYNKRIVLPNGLTKPFHF